MASQSHYSYCLTFSRGNRVLVVRLDDRNGSSGWSGGGLAVRSDGLAVRSDGLAVRSDGLARKRHTRDIKSETFLKTGRVWE